MKLRLVVGEPRDFRTKDNTNVIIGILVDDLSGSRKVDEKRTEYWYVCNCEPLEYEGVKFSSLVLIPRYRTPKPPLELLKEGAEVVFHCAWKKDYIWDATSLDAAREGRLEIDGTIIANATLVKEE